MNPVKVHFLGSGDAFGSGGRLQTCIYVNAGAFRFFIDCGPSVLPASNRAGISVADIDAIFLTHLHGDHFGGVPFVLLDAQLVQGRTGALMVSGPPGVAARITDLAELLFPGTFSQSPPFPVHYEEFEDRMRTQVGKSIVTPFLVVHQKQPPSFALRIECADRIVAYSGDTEWTDVLREVADDTDLFICESHQYDSQKKNHLDYHTILAHRDELNCSRLVLTHMGPDMLQHVDDIDITCAEDGMVITL